MLRTLFPPACPICHSLHIGQARLQDQQNNLKIVSNFCFSFTTEISDTTPLILYIYPLAKLRQAYVQTFEAYISLVVTYYYTNKYMLFSQKLNYNTSNKLR